MYAMNFGISRTILKSNEPSTFKCTRRFNTRKRRMRTIGEDFSREADMQFMPRTVCFLSYRFKINLDEKENKPKIRPSKEIMAEWWRFQCKKNKNSRKINF